MDLKIKKYWLLSSIIYLAMLLINGLVTDPFFNFEFAFFSPIIVIPFGYLLLETLNFVGLYLFSYKKNGTVLLTLNILLSVMRMYLVAFPFLFWDKFSVIYSTQTNAKLILDFFISFINFICILQWFVFSLKLKSANKRAQKNEKLSHPDYQRLIKELQSIKDMDELSLKYGAAVRNNPQIAWALKKIYKERQLELSKA